MPNRILRDWTDSRAVHNAGEEGENLFVRLIMKADDYGRYVAEPQLLRSLCYPYRDDLRIPDMSRRLAACQQAGLVRCYEVCQTGATRWLSADELTGVPALGAKWYLVIEKFNQQTRAKASKFPEPPPLGEHPPNGCSTSAQHVREDAQQMRSYSDAEAQAHSETEALPQQRAGAHAREAPGAAESEVREMLETTGLKFSIALNTPAHSELIELTKTCGKDLVLLALRKAGSNGHSGPRAVGYARTICIGEKAKADLQAGDSKHGKRNNNRTIREGLSL